MDVWVLIGVWMYDTAEVIGVFASVEEIPSELIGEMWRQYDDVHAEHWVGTTKVGVAITY